MRTPHTRRPNTITAETHFRPPCRRARRAAALLLALALAATAGAACVSDLRAGRDAALDKLGLDVIHNVGGKFTRRSADVGPKEV